MRKVIVALLLVALLGMMLVASVPVKAVRLTRIFLGTVDVVASGNQGRCYPGTNPVAAGWTRVDDTHYYRYVRYSDWDYFTFFFDYHLQAPGLADNAQADRGLFDFQTHFLGSIRYNTDSSLYGTDETSPWPTVGHGEYQAALDGVTFNGWLGATCGPVNFLVRNSG